MEKTRRTRPVHVVLARVAAAAFCLGIAALVALQYAAPERFDRLVQPLADWAETLLQQPEPEQPSDAAPETPTPELQLAGDPIYQTERPIEDPKVTEFVDRSGHEALTGGATEMYYFNQGEEPWASASYGPDPIGGYGCGPTSMAMVVSTLGDLFVNPTDMARWAWEAGYCCPGSGSYHSIVEGTAAAFGIPAESWQDFSAEALCRDLASGHVFVALMAPGHFTASGHFIVLRGLTLEGEVLVADPNSRERSLTAWDPQLILDELSPSRSNGAPIWRFTVDAS